MKKYVFYNVRAAVFSRKNTSWLSAQRYYENAYNEIQRWPAKSFDSKPKYTLAFSKKLS